MAERIALTNDIDGVLVGQTFAAKTYYHLLGGECPIPTEQSPIDVYRHAEKSLQKAADAVSIFLHAHRPPNTDALEGLADLSAFTDIYNIEARFAVVSGRTPEKHNLTRKQLRTMGYMEYFQKDLLFLNPGKHPGIWKEQVTRWFVSEGIKVIHIDDDIRAGLCMSRVHPTLVQVYILDLLSGLLPLQPLLQKAGVELPANITIVNSYTDAVRGIKQAWLGANEIAHQSA